MQLYQETIILTDEDKSISLEEDIKRMKELASGKLEHDKEFWHAEADDIILKYVPKALADEYLKVGRWFA